jgi:uncharacterized membrane protein YvlD (DUF360 family)
MATAPPAANAGDSSGRGSVGVEYGRAPEWGLGRPRIHLLRVVLAWILSAAALLIAAWVVPGAAVGDFGSALAGAAVIAILNAVLPPVVAAVRLPYTALLGFFIVLVLDAFMLLAADHLTDGLSVSSFWTALAVAVVATAMGVLLHVVLGTNDDDTYMVRVIQRIARRSGQHPPDSTPGILFLEIDGLALPVLQRAMRNGSAPTLARWLEEGSHRLVEWETDLSSQTGASQAGILLGSNDDIPAFRWVEKETATLMVFSTPADCAEIERRRVCGRGLLAHGGASRGNLISGEADYVILTASRSEAEKRANPGYRAFFANGFNVLRALALSFWEVILEWTAAARAKRRDVRPRGNRGGYYPFFRAAICVILRDLIVYGVLTDMMNGRPAVYATFSSYDEVAHHSGLERPDTLEALRKLDQQFARIERARRYAPRPYKIIVLSDHGQTQGATFKQRNGYGLDELVRQSVERAAVVPLRAGDENESTVGRAVDEASGRKVERRSKRDVSDEDVVVLASGNLGLIYLLEESRRLTLEEIEARHPRLVPALRAHPDIGWLLVRSEWDGPVVLGSDGTRFLATGTIDGQDPLADFSTTAPQHLLRASGFPHVADIVVGSSYDPALEEGHAFEELISFHGGLGGPQTRPFLLYPAELPFGGQAIVGAEAVNGLLLGWRQLLQDDIQPEPYAKAVPAEAGA